MTCWCWPAALLPVPAWKAWRVMRDMFMLASRPCCLEYSTVCQMACIESGKGVE